MKKDIKPLSVVLTILFYTVFIVFVGMRSNGTYDWASLVPYKSLIVKGWMYTLALSVSGLFFSVIFGLVLYFMKESKITTVKYIAKVFTEVMFGSPMLVVVVFMYYLVGNAFNINDKFMAATIILTAYNSTYISEIYRGGMESIPQGQWEAAKVFGFSRFQTYRYIILPQVFRNILPPLTGQLALLVKSTSLLSYMAINEFFNTIMGINASTYAYIEGYVVLAIGYLVMTIPLSIFIKYLEGRLKVEE